MLSFPRAFRFLAPLLLCASANASSGLEVMKKIEKSNQGMVGGEASMTMTLIDAEGRELERKMKAKSLEEDEDGATKSLLEFVKPLDVKGTKLLTWTEESGNSKQWLYLPQFRRVKKINSRNQAGSFMGSEFSFEDIAGQKLERHNYKLLEENENAWTVQSTPKTDSGYSKIVSVLSKKFMNPVSAKYYDRKGELLKTSKIEGYTKHTVNGKDFYLATSVRMDNVQTDKASVITWEKRRLGVKHNKRDFRSSRLK